MSASASEGSTTRVRRAGGWLIDHWRRVLLGLVAAWVLLLLVSGVVAGLSLRAAGRHGEQARTALAAHDVEAATRAVNQTAAPVHRARQALSAAWWAPVQLVPGLGDDVRAVRTTVSVGDDVLQHDVAPLVRTTSTLQHSARRPDGALDTDQLAAVQRDLADRVAAASAGAARVNALDLDGVLPPMRQPLANARDLITQVADGQRAAADGLLVATTVLGGREPQTTMVAVQNPAEARGTGGLIGAFALVRGDKGDLTLASTGVNDELLRFRTSVRDLPPEVRKLYGAQVRDVRNVNLSPDFPVAARLLVNTYARAAKADDLPSMGRAPALITITPDGLGRLLKVTGPIAVPGAKKVTAENAGRLFGNKIYSNLPSTDARSAYVQLVLQTVFLRLTESDIDPLRLVDAIRKATATGDLMAWSADDQTQAALVRLGAAGAIGRPTGDTVRVSLVNSDGSKLDYFVRATVTLNAPGCGLQVILGNEAPAHVGKAIANPSVRDPALRTSHQLTLQVHLPPTVGVLSTQVDGRAKKVASGPEQGWTVVRLGLNIPSQSSTSVCLDLSGRTAALSTVVPPVLTKPAVVTPLQANAYRDEP